MSNTSKRLDRLADRLAVLAARRARPAGGFVSQPEPRSIGLYTRGKQLLSGNILLAGHLAEAPGVSLWDVAAPGGFAAEAQGFGWLDDLAALGTKEAQARAQDWTWGWIDEVPENVWQPLEVRLPAKASFRNAIRDFYLTNPIARASSVMAELSAMAKARAAAPIAAE